MVDTSVSDQEETRDRAAAAPDGHTTPGILRHAEELTGNVALTCRSSGIGRQCCSTWRRRYDADGLDGLRDRSHRPQVSPNTTRTEVVASSSPCAAHHVGPAKIAMYLKRYHQVQLSPSGVWRILKWVELHRLPASQRHKRHDRRWQRYEQPLPGHRRYSVSARLDRRRAGAG